MMQFDIEKVLELSKQAGYAVMEIYKKILLYTISQITVR